MHWVLDVAFPADPAGILRDQAPHNLAILRRIALNVLPQEKTTRLGIANRQFKVAWAPP